MFHHVVLGGTFDHIHKGHEALLHRAFLEGERVTIGLTTDTYVKNAKCPMLNAKYNSYETRRKYLEEWLKKQKFFDRTTIVPIDDSFGPSVSSGIFDAIVVSKETEKVAKKINIVRVKRGLPPLAIIVVPMVPADDAKIISSTRIRNGEIDHGGCLILPDALRGTLAQPIGVVISDKAPIPHPSPGVLIISVGDTTTETLLSQGITPALAIVDFHVRRELHDWKIDQWKKLTEGRTIAHFASGPGFINKKVMVSIRRWSKQPEPTLFIIDGEEDLLVLPAILYAPMGSIVYYGQPYSGIVQVIVTPKIKQRAQQLLSQFIRV